LYISYFYGGGVMVKTRNIEVQIAEDEYETIKRHSLFFGSSMSDFIIEAVRERLEYFEDVAALRDRNKGEPRISWEDVQRNAGLL
jgi:hypothetical protein